MKHSTRNVPNFGTIHCFFCPNNNGDWGAVFMHFLLFAGVFKKQRFYCEAVFIVHLLDG